MPMHAFRDRLANRHRDDDDEPRSGGKKKKRPVQALRELNQKLSDGKAQYRAHRHRHDGLGGGDEGDFGRSGGLGREFRSREADIRVDSYQPELEYEPSEGGTEPVVDHLPAHESYPHVHPRALAKGALPESSGTVAASHSRPWGANLPQKGGRLAGGGGGAAGINGMGKTPYNAAAPPGRPVGPPVSNALLWAGGFVVCLLIWALLFFFVSVSLSVLFFFLVMLGLLFTL